MAESNHTARVCFLANPGKPSVPAMLDDLVAFARKRCVVVGSALNIDTKGAVAEQVDRIVVLGGDGTLIGVARSLAENQIPLIGVNAGKLGFLAEFSAQELKTRFSEAVGDDSLVSRRIGLSVEVLRNGGKRSCGLAMNDCVIQAGPPFRMVRLGVSIDGEPVTVVPGDGLIVCTPSGSTAHSLSAGGPILQPGVDAIVLTPLSPHSLTHRPVVFESSVEIEITATSINAGTTAILDGQVSYALKPQDRVRIRRNNAHFLLVRNPAYMKWHKLVTKMHWGQAPEYD